MATSIYTEIKDLRKYLEDSMDYREIEEFRTSKIKVSVYYNEEAQTRNYPGHQESEARDVSGIPEELDDETKELIIGAAEKWVADHPDKVKESIIRKQEEMKYDI